VNEVKKEVFSGGTNSEKYSLNTRYPDLPSADSNPANIVNRAVFYAVQYE